MQALFAFFVPIQVVFLSCSFIVASEFHAVGIYEASGVVEVHVDRPDQDVTLYLSANDPTSWRVTSSPSTNVSRVIVAGREPQVISAPENASIDLSCPDFCARLGYRSDVVRFRDNLKQISGFVGSELDSFQGSYTGSRFVVDSVQDDERILSGYPLGTPASMLPDLTFQAVDAEADPKTFGWFTLLGPISTTQQVLPLDRNGDKSPINTIAIDPVRGTVYGSTPGPVVVEASQMSEMKVDASFEWPFGMTFDTKRDRLLIGSFSGEGFLYAYDPGTDDWSVLSSLGDKDLSALAYDEANDQLYGIEPRHNDWPSLHTFDPDTGSVTSTWHLDDRMYPELLPPWQFPRAQIQMIAIDNYLVLKDTGREHNTFLLDPNEQQIWRVVPEPNALWPISSALLLSLSIGRRGRRSIRHGA